MLEFLFGEVVYFGEIAVKKFYKDWKSQSGGAINLEDVFKESQEEYLTQK